MGRAKAPGPEPRRVPRPPTRVGAGAEGWEGGGTDVWPHLNPFPTRRRQVEPLRGEGPPRALQLEPGGRPLFPPAALSPAILSAAPKAARLWDGAGLPRLRGGGQGDGLPSLFSCSPLGGGGGVGVPCFGPDPSPRVKIATPVGTSHKAPRPREPRPQPPFPPPPSPLAPAPPRPSSPSGAGPLRLLLSPPPASARTPPLGRGWRVVTEGGGPRPPWDTLTLPFRLGSIPLLCSPGSLSATFSGSK